MTVKLEKDGAEGLESPGSAVARSGPPLWAQWVPAKPPGALSRPPHTSARSPPTEGGSEAPLSLSATREMRKVSFTGL